MLKFKSLSNFEKGHWEIHDYQWSDDDDPTLVDSEKNKILIELARASFLAKREALRSSVEDKSFNFLDDALYLSFRFFDQTGDKDAAMRNLCQIVAARAPGFDHILLAQALLKVRSHVCAR